MEDGEIAVDYDCVNKEIETFFRDDVDVDSKNDASYCDNDSDADDVKSSVQEETELVMISLQLIIMVKERGGIT